MKWAGNNIFMRTCPGWSGSDLQAIEDAADEWNALTESAVDISVSPDPNPCNQIPGAVDLPPNVLLPQIWYQNGSNPSTALALTMPSRPWLMNPALILAMSLS